MGALGLTLSFSPLDILADVNWMAVVDLELDREVKRMNIHNACLY